MARTIAITGATGFVGRRLVRHFAANGWSVRALARRTGGLDPTPGVDLVPGALEDEASLERLVLGADAAVHCAGLIKAADAAAFFSVNERGTKAVAAACAKSEACTRFVHISSLAARLPDISPYAASKRAGELRLGALSDELDWTVLRPPVIYGPGDRETLKLFRLMRRGIAFVPGSAESRISMIYIDDLCSAVERAVVSEGMEGRILEVHDGARNGYSWRDVADAAGRYFGRKVRSVAVPEAAMRPLARVNRGMARLTGSAPMVTPEKLREIYHSDWVCRSNPLTASTGWTPAITIIEGFRRTCHWYEREGWL